jgi:hypothetical protein
VGWWASGKRWFGFACGNMTFLLKQLKDHDHWAKTPTTDMSSIVMWRHDIEVLEKGKGIFEAEHDGDFRAWVCKATLSGWLGHGEMIVVHDFAVWMIGVEKITDAHKNNKVSVNVGWIVVISHIYADIHTLCTRLVRTHTLKNQHLY